MHIEVRSTKRDKVNPLLSLKNYCLQVLSMTCARYLHKGGCLERLFMHLLHRHARNHSVMAVGGR